MLPRSSPRAGNVAWPRYAICVSAATERVSYRVYPGRSRPGLRHALLLTLGLVGLVGIGLAAQAYATRDVIVPGVSIAGVDVGGLTPDQARARLTSEVGDRLARPMQVRAGTAIVTVVPARIGIGLDVEAAVAAAYSSGRVAERLLPYVYSADVAPPLVLSSQTLPPELAALTRPAVDAALSVSPSGVPSVSPATDGVSLDAPTALRAIGVAALAGDTATVVLRPVSPAITTADAQQASAQVSQTLSAPVTLMAGNHRLGRLRPADLAPLLRVATAGGAFALTFDQAGLTRLVRPLARHAEKQPRDAHFRTHGKRAVVVRGVNGLKFDAAGTATAIAQAGLLPQSRVAQVAMISTPPHFTTQQARALGITRALFKTPITTSMGASSANRIWNVHLLAQILDGHIIQAGETFDFNQVVGQRTVERGFRTGQQIENGQLVPAVGGGVCQVATTLFDAAFYAGLKITARTNHQFYISHYPLGMDATVSWGGPEFRFVNTLHHAILLRMSYTNSTLSAQFYSTPDGIRVTQVTGPRSGAGAGFNVTVFRTIRRNGKVVRRDSFSSHYVPPVVPKPPAVKKPKKKHVKPPVQTPPTPPVTTT